MSILYCYKQWKSVSLPQLDLRKEEESGKEKGIKKDYSYICLIILALFSEATRSSLQSKVVFAHLSSKTDS